MAAVATLLWGGVRLPASWKPLLAIGLIPAIAWGLGTAVWTALTLVERIGGGSPGGTDVWATVTTTLVATALAALPQWKIPKLALSATAMAGAIVIVVAASSMAFAVADAVGAHVEGALAISGVLAALVAVAFTALWTTASARWANGIGATVVMTVSGINAALHLADPLATWWAASLISVAPVVLLAVFARWWPRVTLGPAAFLLTAVVAAVAIRLDWGGSAAVALALAATAALAWAATRLDRAHWLPLVAGVGPALVLGVVAAVAVLVGGVALMLSGSSHEADPADMWWFGAALVMLAASFSAVRALAVSPVVARLGSVAGALAAVAGAVAFTIATGGAVFDRFSPDSSAVSGSEYFEGAESARVASHVWVIVAAIVTSVAVAGTMKLWRSESARLAIQIAATAWLTIAGIRALFEVAPRWGAAVGSAPWGVGVALLVAVAAILGIAATWWPRVTLGPFAFVVSAGVAAAMSGLGASWDVVVLGITVALALLAWFASPRPRQHALAISIGFSPVAALAALALAGHAARMLASLADEMFYGSPTKASVGQR